MLPLPIISNTSILPPPPHTLSGVFSTTSMPTVTSRMHQGYCVVNGEMYVLNGWVSASGDVNATFQKYNPVTNTVSTLAPVPGGAFAHTMSHRDGKIYAHRNNNAMYIYDIALNTWSTVTMPSGTQNHQGYCTSAIIGDDMYIHGGYDSSTNYYNILYKYNIPNNTLTVMGNTPINSSHGLAGAQSDMVLYNSKLYLSSSNGLHEYEPSSNTWRTASNSVFYGKMCINNDILYVLNVSNTEAFKAYDFITNTWTTVGSRTARIYYGCLLSPYPDSTEIYSIGGSASTSGPAISTIYQIT